MTYDAEHIKVLEGLEAVRTRPGMYIGGTGKPGYHHLLWEIIDNSVDEAMAGHATKIEVGLAESGRTAWVKDNGRGVPFAEHKTGGSTLDVVFTKLHAGGKFEGKGYKVSGGLHGVGAAVVNALSRELVVFSTRNGVQAERHYAQGAPRGKLKKSKVPGHSNGTQVNFSPDPEIFGKKLSFDTELIAERLQQKAYLHPDCVFFFRDGKKAPIRIQAKGGLADFLSDRMGEELEPLVAPFVASHAADDVRVDVALTWTEAPKEDLTSFANGIPTHDGGTHLQGLRDVVGREIKTLVDDKGKLPKKWQVTRGDVFEGVTAVIAVYVSDPQFQGQTKDRLNNPEVQRAVGRALREDFRSWLALTANHTPILQRVVQAVRARMASRDAQAAVRRKTPVSSRLTLPGKLADCSSRDADSTELFLVEGDSAGGSAKQARDRKTQAILPLRGKVLNTEGVSIKKLMSNQEIRNIIEALGCGVGPAFDISKLRYGKVILLMDADTDGAHISVLVLTLMYRHLRPLIDAGRVFLAQPPLYAVKTSSGSVYLSNDAELEKARRKTRGKLEISRFKGLGEMQPKELWATTMDPARRTLLKVGVPAGEEVRTELTIQDLMGDDASRRVELISEADPTNMPL